MGDYDELEVGLLHARGNDAVQGLGKTFDVVLVQIGCRFVQSNELEELLVSS